MKPNLNQVIYKQEIFVNKKEGKSHTLLIHIDNELTPIIDE